MFQKKILWFGSEQVIACDGKCNKAFGLDRRPKELFDPNDEDDFAYLSDDECGEATVNLGSWEGGDGKPEKARSGDDMNRWCVRQCCRSNLHKPGEPITLRDLTKRLYNQPFKHSEAK